MAQILDLIHAKRGIEVGVFLGYGTLCMALCPTVERVLALDVSAGMHPARYPPHLNTINILLSLDDLRGQTLLTLEDHIGFGRV